MMMLAILNYLFPGIEKRRMDRIRDHIDWTRMPTRGLQR